MHPLQDPPQFRPPPPPRPRRLRHGHRHRQRHTQLAQNPAAPREHHRRTAQGHAKRHEVGPARLYRRRRHRPVPDQSHRRSQRQETRVADQEAHPRHRLRAHPDPQHPLRWQNRHQQQRSPRPADHPQVDGHRRRWRHRLRAGLRLRRDGHQSHHRRSPRPPPAHARFLGEPTRRTRVQEPRHRGPHRQEGHRRRQKLLHRQGQSRRRSVPRGRTRTGGGRSPRRRR